MYNVLKKFFVLIFVLAITGNAQTIVNGQFVVTNHNSSIYTINVQINTNSGTNGLGTSTIIFNFDSTALTFPSTPVNGTDYTFLNFSGGNYSPATITRPTANQIWLNIELLNTNNGTLVTKSPGWIDVATITFNIINHSGSSNLTWQNTNSNWAIFDANNSTIWTNGTFTNLNTSPLPVELTSFAANINNNKVELNWQTATEVNNYGFEIQRAKKSDNLMWEKIGFVEGNGTSNSPKSYRFDDNNPLQSNLVYRLKQLDINGDYKYSKEIEINLTPKDYVLFQNYPNPFNPSTTIKFSLPNRSFVNIKVYDITGREVAILFDGAKEAGTYSIDFNASNLSSGTYFYRISAGNFVQVRKMLLLK
ncbi:MAG: T9SS type A sorting domain-containing protein [Bacteroidetes bacterium]|nr:T9SS type A sorting domain-containing protein [Bacteroidota bacterium]